MRSIRRTLAVAAAASLVLGACTSDDEPDATDATGTDGGDTDDGTDTPEDVGATDGDATDAGDGSDAAGGDDATASDDGAAASGGEAPSGTVEVTDASVTSEAENLTVEVTSIEVQDAAVIVTAEAFNRGGSQHHVIGGNEMVRLYDDQGGDYTWVPPEDGAQFILSAGDEASFTWAFRGAPRPGASSFVLTLNHWPGIDGDPNSGGGRVPFRFEDLPMPGVSS